MINDVKQAVMNKLCEVYPTEYTIYDEDIPDNFNKPSFLINVSNQSYNRGPNNKCTSTISLDISYYSDKEKIKTDCLIVQEKLLRAFDLIGSYRARNRNAKITEDVLHITLDIQYSEVNEDISYSSMQKLQTNTII